MNKQQLAAKIWESANQMRSKIEANEYKDYILGFIFYKYLSNKQTKLALKNDFSVEDLENLTEEDLDAVQWFKENNGYFIEYKNLFSTWVESKQDFHISNVHDALSAFERLISKKYKKLFSGVFNTLETGLSKLGDTAAKQTKSVSDLLHLINDIPMDGNQDYDVLGFIYEYLIEKFAASAGKKAGEFYTPHEVSLLMSEITAHHLKDNETISIYDPTSGSGSLLINIGTSVGKYMTDKNKIKYYAQELKQNTYNLTRMNLVMRGISPGNIFTRNADTLEDDWPYFDENDPNHTYDPLRLDAVVSNPPYSQKWDPSFKDNDPRYSRFGLAPKSKADYAFLLHDLFHLKPNGIMTIVLPHGVLFRGGEEGQIRKNLIEYNNVEAIIGLPPSIFFGTGIPTIIMVLRQQRSETDVLFVDASKGFIKDGKNNKLRASDIKKIVDTVKEKRTDHKYSRLVSKEEIRNNEYNLNIPRYVDSAETAENWDIYASMFGGIPKNEIDALEKYWEALPNLKADIFTENTPENFSLKAENISEIIHAHSDIQVFQNDFDTYFADFDQTLTSELLEKIDTLNIASTQTKISDEIFTRFKNISLIDPYHAYQIFDDQWQDISGDLEILKTEGMTAATVVDPNMVMKKKNGKEVEVQEGWKGRIFPFELVQKNFLLPELEKLESKENRLAEIASERENILESLSEDDKEEGTINEAKDDFVNAQVIKEAKALRAEATKNGEFEAESYEAQILKIDELITEEKQLKKDSKKEAENLHLQTKTTIEDLNPEQVQNLLEQKWITPIITALQNLPTQEIETLVQTLQNLADKYSTTFAQVAESIDQSQKNLRGMMDELQGSEADIKGLEAFKNLLQ